GRIIDHDPNKSFQCAFPVLLEHGGDVLRRVERDLERQQRVGIGLLFLLTALALYNDLTRLLL
ncbi:MAG: hypothetical protein N2688_10390, partial [Burkholderiaceae bacterium]|nr:hypothetical protein [Burkholderiaceae bacterium]